MEYRTGVVLSTADHKRSMHSPASQVNVSFNGVSFNPLAHSIFYRRFNVLKGYKCPSNIGIIIISLHITLHDLKKTKGSISLCCKMAEQISFYFDQGLI